MTWEQTADVLAKEAARLQKENDRLRAFVHDVAYVNASDFADGWKALVEFAKRGRELLSPAAEWGGAANGGESKPIVCHEMTEEETAEAAEIIRKAWEGVDAEQSAWEKSLHEASQRALKTVWWNAKHGKSANGGESQAIQTAIMGLHTLAGEFPTPTWKTREDYLQATISEINEILGK